jgi:hypothetical protein
MIKISNQFKYIPLNRVTDPITGIRYYESPTGESLPSVTTILGQTGNKDALMEWRKRVGDKEANRISKEAAGLGTLMHTHLEKWILGEQRPEGNNVVRKLAADMAEVVIQCGMKNFEELWGQEVALYYPGLYSGTTDLVGIHKGSPAIIDFKTSKKIKKPEWIEDYWCQTTSYAIAHNYLYGTDIKKCVIFMVARDLKFQEFTIEGNQFDYYVAMWLKRLETFISKYS